MRLSSVAIRLAKILAVVRHKGETLLLARTASDRLGIDFDQNGVGDAVLCSMIWRKTCKRPLRDTALYGVRRRQWRICHQKFFNLLDREEGSLVARNNFVVYLIECLQRAGAIFIIPEAVHRVAHQPEMGLQAAPRVLNNAPLVAGKFVHDDLRNHKLDLPRYNQIFQSTDYRLFPIIFRKIDPDACIYQEV